ncbi:MAG: hypothetical protein M3Y21_02045 [Candidatus Eremiobacteraeota bacterium]|nr:hypothetical protein [Candidatus Eremiobacteraeota bacterium]
MEFFGTKLTITLGSWRLRFVLALEETEEIVDQQIMSRPHHVSVNRHRTMKAR